MTSPSKFEISENQEVLHENFPSREPLNALILGKPGSGKSSLINSFASSLKRNSESKIYLYDMPGWEDRMDQGLICKFLEEAREREIKPRILVQQSKSKSKSITEKILLELLSHFISLIVTCTLKLSKQLCEENQPRDAEGFESLEIKGRHARQDEPGELFSALSSLESLNLDFSRCRRVLEQGMLDLSQDIIPKLKNIKSFDINFYDSDIMNETVQKLAWSLKEKFVELEDFKCNLGQTKVTEKMIVQFFHEMPKMKNFELNIGNCVFTDYGMRIFIRNSLKSMSALENLNLDFQGTDATSSQITDLLRNIPLRVKKLYLDFRWTRTTSEALRIFMNEKLPMLKDLEEIEIKVDSTLASKGMKQEIDTINRKYAKKIDLQECERYLQMLS